LPTEEVGDAKPLRDLPSSIDQAFQAVADTIGFRKNVLWQKSCRWALGDDGFSI
jgi:hypothetical protein